MPASDLGPHFLARKEGLHKILQEQQGLLIKAFWISFGAFSVEGPVEPRSCRSRAAPLRRNHNLLAHPPLGRRQRQKVGADEVGVSRNADEMHKHAGSFNFILDAVSAVHDINAYIQLLRRHGNLTMVGAPEKPGLADRRHRRNPGNARFLRRPQHHRGCRSQPYPDSQRRLRETGQSDVKYRSSIDMASLKSE